VQGTCPPEGERYLALSRISCICNRYDSLVLIGLHPTYYCPLALLISILPSMARYSTLLGRRIEETYRDGEIILPASGSLAADSGKSIFLEESYKQKNGMKTFRWEIPYACIVQLNECPEMPRPSASLNEPREAAAESAPNNAAFELKKNPA